MAQAPTRSSNVVVKEESPESYVGPLAVLTTLFFMWGSLTSLNDVLIPFAQNVFKLRIDASMLIQTAFFSAYFIVSIPAAKIIDWIGYKRAIIVGLLTMVAACLCFYPAARMLSFPFFLGALIILAAGITILQVAANPYVSVLGSPQTASSRLNLTQAFNSLGTTIFPWIGAKLILGTTSAAVAGSVSQESEAVIKLYVYFFSFALLVLAIAIGLFKLPKMEAAEHHIGETINDSVWRHPNLIFGAIGIFVYVGGEVAIGSGIANFLALDNIGGFISQAGIPDAATRYHAALGEAATYISLYWGGAMVGRFIGAALLNGVKALYLGAVFVIALLLIFMSYQTASSGLVSTSLSFLASVRPLVILSAATTGLCMAIGLFRKGWVVIKTPLLLAICAGVAALLVTISVLNNGSIAMWSILLVGFFNSIMFPCIFTMGIAELGPLTGDGSGIMNMAIVGGAIIPLIVGKLAQFINDQYYPAMTQGKTSWGQGIHYALLATALCYLYILFFAVSGSKPNSERHLKA